MNKSVFLPILCISMASCGVGSGYDESWFSVKQDDPALARMHIADDAAEKSFLDSLIQAGTIGQGVPKALEWYLVDLGSKATLVEFSGAENAKMTIEDFVVKDRFYKTLLPEAVKFKLKSEADMKK